MMQIYMRILFGGSQHHKQPDSIEGMNKKMKDGNGRVRARTGMAESGPGWEWQSQAEDENGTPRIAPQI